MEQIQDEDDVDAVELNPVDLSLPMLKEVGTKWLVEISEFISANPQLIVNGFLRAGIDTAIDGIFGDSADSSDSETSESDYTSEDDSEDNGHHTS